MLSRRGAKFDGIPNFRIIVDWLSGALSKKEARNGRQRQEGQGKGPETEVDKDGTEVERKTGQATEKNPVVGLTDVPLLPIVPGLGPCFHRFVEVLFHWRWLGKLKGTELLELQFRLPQCFLVGNSSGVSEDVSLAQAQEIIQLRDPVAHIHWLAIQRLQFGKFKFTLLHFEPQRGTFQNEGGRLSFVHGMD